MTLDERSRSHIRSNLTTKDHILKIFYGQLRDKKLSLWDYLYHWDDKTYTVGDLHQRSRSQVNFKVSNFQQIYHVVYQKLPDRSGWHFGFWFQDGCTRSCQIFGLLTLILTLLEVKGQNRQFYEYICNYER